MKHNKIFILLFLIFTILMVNLFSGLALAEEINKVDLVKVVRKLHKYNFNSEERNKLQDSIIKSLRYGVNQDFIFKYLNSDNAIKVENEIKLIDKAVQYNIPASKINKAILEGNLNSIINEGHSKELEKRRYIVDYYAEYEKTYNEELWLPIPQVWEGNGNLEVELIGIEPSPEKVYNDVHGNKIVYWDDFNKFRDKYGIKFEITINKINHDLEDKNYKIKYDKDSEIYKRYTVPVEGVRSDNPKIKNKALEIVGDSEDPLEKVDKFIAWMNNNLSYGDAGSRKAEVTLEKKTGDCANFANLFVAFSRAVGIPARNVSVFHPMPPKYTEFQSGKHGKTFNGHIITEIYLEEYGWYQIDPGNDPTKDNMIRNIPYYAMIFTKGSKVEFQRDNSKHYYNFFHIPVHTAENGGQIRNLFMDIKEIK